MVGGGGGGGGVGLVYDERMCAHANSEDPFHVEKPARITSIFRALESAGIVERCERVEARDATPGELASVHTEEHVVKMCAVSSQKYSKWKRNNLARDYNSIYFNEGSSSSALLAAGSVVEACLRVARGELGSAAAVVRPPGHHAEADEAMGFCLFNNVAVAAHVLVHGNPDLGVSKVLIVDWDVHHGNGTQHMFWTDPQVLYFSIHRHDFGGFYPGGDGGDYDKIGEASGTGFNINVPWPHEGYGDRDYLTVFDQVLMPVAQEFKPDIVLVSGGFDSAAGDPLGSCEVTPAGYSQMTSRLMGLANGRVVLALEGGYNLKSIADSYQACMEVLLGDQPKKTLGTKHHLSTTVHIVEQVRAELEPYWSALSTKDLAKKVEDLKIGDPADSESRRTGDSSVDDLLVSLSGLTVAGKGSESVPSTESSGNPPGKEAAGGGKSSAEDSTTSAEEGSAKSRRAAGPTSSSSHSQPSEGDDVLQSKPGNEGGHEKEDLAGDHQDPESKYVWYASYASNLWTARFMCYIEGGQVEGLAVRCVGARNQAPPVASCWMTIPHTMYFGHLFTGSWGKGGGAFLDPVSHGGPPTTQIRLYKITGQKKHRYISGKRSEAIGNHRKPTDEKYTARIIRLQQFCDVLLQENDMNPNEEPPTIDWERINRLRDTSAASHSMFEMVKDYWYGTLKYLGEKDGLPILTITCSSKHIQQLKKGEFSFNPPSDRYRKVIIRGLLENEQWSEEEAKAYLVSICSNR